MTPQKVIDDYEYLEGLQKFIERYESMTDEERAAVPKTEVELDWTADEEKQFRAAAETAGMTLDAFVELAIYEALKRDYVSRTTGEPLACGSAYERESQMEDMTERMCRNIRRKSSVDFSVED